MKMFATIAAGAVLLGTAVLAQDLPDLAGREIVVVTENAYPPLQFVVASGSPVGWVKTASSIRDSPLTRSTRWPRRR